MNNQKFFVLNSECFLVKGAKRGAIYDLRGGDVYSIDETSVSILENLEKGNSIDKCFNSYGVNFEAALSYLNEFEKLGLGRFVSNGYILKKKEIRTTSDKLNFIHFEIAERCNLRCAHCYNGSRANNKKHELGLGDYLKLLSEARALGCKAFQFIGGEPFLRKNLIFTLLPDLFRAGYDFVEIFTNGTLITKDDLAVIKDYGVRLAFSLYSHQSKAHDYITHHKGSWAKTVNTIKMAKSMGIPVRVATVIMRYNEDNIKETKRFIKEILNVDRIKVDFVRPSGRGCSSSLVSDTMCENQKLFKPKFSKINSDFFYLMRSGHNCFMNKIYVSSEGLVYPCVMERSIVYGDVKEKTLESIFSSDLVKRIRFLNKDQVKICCNCEYRYCCFDCRVKARAYDKNNLYAKPWWCQYDPYKGKWLQKERRWKREKIAAEKSQYDNKQWTMFA